MTWQTHASRTAYENRWIRVREDDVTRPDGTPGLYGVVEVRQPAVFVVAMTDDDEVVLVELHRYTIGADSLEVSAGGSDGADGAEPGHGDAGDDQAEEGITAGRRVPWTDVLRMVADGTITDGETVAALMYAALALGRVH